MDTKSKPIKITMKNLKKYQWILEQPYASLLSQEMDLEKYCYFHTLHETVRKQAPELNFFHNTDYDAFIVNGYSLLRQLGNRYEESKAILKDIHLARLTTRNYIFQWDIYNKIYFLRRFMSFTDTHEDELHKALSITTDLMSDKRMFGFNIRDLNEDGFNPHLPLMIATIVLDEYFLEVFKDAFPKTFEAYGEETLRKHYHQLLSKQLEETAVKVESV